jgi:carbonic anhydrase/acetyltransferase-like protein (isoleucine patch superfamily)
MPLSDHERQVLADMEAALVKEDPKLVSTFSGLPKGGKGFTLGALTLIGGMAVLIGGLVAKSVLIGVLGFVIALVGLIIGINALPKAGESPVKSRPKRSNWADRMNERWDNRDQ